MFQEIHKEWFSNKERKETLHHYSCFLDCGRKIDDEKYLPKIVVTVLIFRLIIMIIVIIMRWWSYFESM